MLCVAASSVLRSQALVRTDSHSVSSCASPCEKSRRYGRCSTKLQERSACGESFCIRTVHHGLCLITCLCVQEEAAGSDSESDAQPEESSSTASNSPEAGAEFQERLADPEESATLLPQHLQGVPATWADKLARDNALSNALLEALWEVPSTAPCSIHSFCRLVAMDLRIVASALANPAMSTSGRLLIHAACTSLALIAPLAQGDIKLVEQLLMHGANPNARDIHKNSALSVACDGDELEAVRLLLEAGAEVDGRLSLDDTMRSDYWCQEYETPLILAASRNSHEVKAGNPVLPGFLRHSSHCCHAALKCLYILAKHAFGSRRGAHALLLLIPDTMTFTGGKASARAWRGCLLYIIEAEMDTPLVGNKSGVKSLQLHSMSAGSFVHPQSGCESGAVVQQYAAIHFFLQTPNARALLCDVAGTLFFSDEFGCALQRSGAVLPLLLEHGADPNAESAWAESPLGNASVSGWTDAVSRLLEAGALVNKKFWSRTPLQLAAAAGYPQVSLAPHPCPALFPRSLRRATGSGLSVASQQQAHTPSTHGLQATFLPGVTCWPALVHG